MTGPIATFIGVADQVLVNVARDFNVPLDGAMATLLRMRRTEALPHRGKSSSGIIYSFHGRGCTLRAGPHGVVDVDSSETGGPMFDVWRVRQWAESAGASLPPDPLVLDEAAELVRAGRLQVVADGWWTWALGSESPAGS